MMPADLVREWSISKFRRLRHSRMPPPRWFSNLANLSLGDQRMQAGNGSFSSANSMASQRVAPNDSRMHTSNQSQGSNAPEAERTEQSLAALKQHVNRRHRGDWDG